MDELVHRLCTGEHPVRLGGRDPSVGYLEERIELGSVFVTFTATCGGTELLVRLDPERTRTSAGGVHLEGTLSLDEVPVRCVADLSLDGLCGTGRLVADTR